MRKLSLLWALLVSALFVVGCGPETPDTPNNPIPDDPIPGGVTPDRSARGTIFRRSRRVS